MTLQAILGSATFWSILAVIPVMLTEYLFRTLQTGWVANLHYYLPLQLAVSYCVYRIITTPNTSLVEAFVVWAISTTVARVFLSVFVLYDDIKQSTWIALGLILTAKAIQSFWR